MATLAPESGDGQVDSKKVIAKLRVAGVRGRARRRAGPAAANALKEASDRGRGSPVQHRESVARMSEKGNVATAFEAQLVTARDLEARGGSRKLRQAVRDRSLERVANRNCKARRDSPACRTFQR